MLSHGSRRLRGRGAATAAGPASVTKSSGSLALLTQLTARKLVPGRHRGPEQRRCLSLTVALRLCAGYLQPSRSVPDDRGMRVSSPEPAVGGYVTPGTRQACLSPLGNRSGKAAWLMYTRRQA